LNAGEGKRKKERENCEASFWLRWSGATKSCQF
jgi:hypothetical protein